MFEKVKVGIPCPKCGHETEKTVAWIKSNDEFICEDCGSTVTVEKENLISGLKEVDESIAEFRKGLRRIGKRR